MADASLSGTHALDLGASTAAAAAAMPNKEAVEGRALIGYESILDSYDVTITPSTETTGYSGQNVKTRLTHAGWKPSATGAQSLTFTAADLGKTVDYLGIAAHNLKSKAATIDLQYSDDGSSWTSLLSGGYAPTSDAPFMLTVASTSKRYFKLVVNVSGVDYPTIGVVMLGERLSLQRGIYVGHRPASFSRSVTYNTSESEGGQIIGRSVVRRLNETDVSLKRITPTWYRSHLADFEEAALESPFFFMWNTDDRYKGEVIFGVLAGDPRPVNEHQSFMAVDYTIRGLA